MKNNHPLANLKLTDLTGELQGEGQQLFSQLAPLQGIPHCHLTPDSSVKHIRNYLMGLKNYPLFKNNSPHFFKVRSASLASSSPVAAEEQKVNDHIIQMP